MNNNNQQACPNCRHMNLANTAICELCGFIFAKQGMTITYCPRSANSFNISTAGDNAPIGNENETIAQASFAISDDNATVIPPSASEQTQNDSANDPMAHFKIFDVLGKGGMGAIYKAQDLTLERFVALKLFYSQAANSQNLLDEARLACKLNHPNIVTIYDIARGQNSNFIVMEWVDGQTLDQLIPKNGLAINQALEYACQIAEGLACAHQNGVIHRDIKPQNIMLNKEGRIKILDFGIAELLRQSQKVSGDSKDSSIAAVGDVTRISGLSGTPKYMAPEQARGEVLDQRADIFSFGILLYEMLTGVRPFEADNINKLKEQLENRTYRTLKELCPQLSNEMVELVDKMLAPNKEERWQTSDELAEALKNIYGELTKQKNWWQRRHWLSQAAMVLPFVVAVGWSVKEIVFPPTTQELVERQVAEAKKIAILPLDNISGDPVLQLFSDGLITTLSSDLAAAGLEQGDGTTWVIPSSEIRRMKDVSVKAVSDKFGVDLVISGSIQHMGSTRSVVLNLINARDGRQLKTSELVIDAENLFKGQGLIQQEVFQFLNWKISNNLLDRFSKERPQFDGAYKFYLEGQGYLYRYDQKGNLDRAIQSFQRAVYIDEKYENAFVGLAETQLRKFRRTLEEYWLGRMAETIEKLRKTNSSHLQIEFLSAELMMQKGEYNQAVNLYQSSISKIPSQTKAYIGLARAYNKSGQKEKAENTYVNASKIFPNNWRVISAQGIFHFRNGEYKKASELFSELTKVSPNNDYGYRNLAACYYALGDLKSAIYYTEKAIELRPSDQALANLGTMYFYLNKYNEAIAAFEKSIELKKTNYIIWGNLADAYKLVSNEKSIDTYNKAKDLAAQTIKLNPNDSLAKSLYFYYAANIYDKKDALSYAPSFEKKVSGLENYFIALAYDNIGSIDLALNHLEMALIQNYSLDEVIKTPLLVKIRQDERFDLLIKRYISN